MTTAPSPDRDSRGSARADFSGSRPDGPEHDGDAFGRVMVPEERPGERRSRRLRGLLALALLAGATFGAYHLWGDFLPGEAGSSRQASVARGPGPGADTAADLRGRVPAAPDPLVAVFSDRARELTAAVRRFRERSRDFRRDRIGCPELARGYEAVDRAMVALARAYVEVRDRLEPGQEQLYERAMAGADSAGRSFDGSGCERVP